MLHGIANTGNSCYMASVVQCVRRVRKALGLVPFKAINLTLSGEMEDAHEFYLKLMEALQGTSLGQELVIEFMDGTRAPYLMLDHNLSYDGPPIQSIGRSVCAYIHLRRRSLSSLHKIIINGVYELHLIGAIAFIPEMKHYYALIEQNGGFLECNDSRIVPASNDVHNICMLFFVCNINA